MERKLLKSVSVIIMITLLYMMIPLYCCLKIEAEEEKYDDDSQEPFLISIQNIESLNMLLNDPNIEEETKRTIYNQGIAIDIEPTSETNIVQSKSDNNSIRTEYLITCDSDWMESTSRDATNNNKVSFYDIKLDRKYTVNVALTDEKTNEKRYYVGNFGASIDRDGSIYLDSSFDDITSLYQDRSTGSSSYFIENYDLTSSELTNLNTKDIGAVILGYIHNTGDTDYYLYQATASGYMHFLLRVPNNYTNLNLNLYVYRYIPATGTSVLLASSTNLSTTDERCVVSVTSGQYYYMKITTVSGTVGTDYTATTTIIPSKAWFPTSNGTSSDGVFLWNTNKLDVLYGATGDPFLPYENYNNNYTMSDGCYIASYSMILANMQAQSAATMYDFRYSGATSTNSFEGTLSPDPYVVFLANNGLDGSNITYNSSTHKFSYASSSWTPFVYHSTLLSHFINSSGISLSYSIFSFNDSPITSYSDLVSRISNALSTHPQGIILIGSNHKVVVTYENGTYYVYDPWSNNKSNYYRRPLQDHITASSAHICFSNILGYLTID